MRKKQQEKIIELFQFGMKAPEIAEKTGVSKTTVYEVIKKLQNPEDSEEPPDADDPDFPPGDDPVDPDPDSPLNDDDVKDDPDLPPDDDEFPDDDFPEEPYTPTPPPSASPDTVAQEVAEALRSEYDKIIHTLGELNRDLLENCTTGFDRATRMLQDSATRLDKLEAKRQDAAPIRDILKELSPNEKPYTIHLLLGMMAYGITFCIGAICGLCDLRTVIYTLFILFLGFAAALFCICVFHARKNEAFAWCALGLMPLPGFLFAGYCFFLMGPSAVRYWLWPFLAIPGAILLVLGVSFLIRCKSVKKEKKDGEA